ncbi:MAG: phage minor capsid protein [Anaerotruncus colihominis]|nr:phage minor capsid protein [Anaerotruncus colihominis]MCQ4735464.1 phage minor capsid protein [Anaerotruncus colihominis]
MEVSAHGGARNKGTGPANHESWQGKVYRWKR